MDTQSKTYLGKKRKAANQIEWVDLPDFRPENCENTRRQYYRCKRCYKEIGQMEAISRNYSECHPFYISDIRNLVGIKEYLLSKPKYM